MAKRKKKSGSDSASGFIWMLLGLSIGLVVAAAVYVVDRREPAPAVSDSAPEAAAPETEVVVTTTQPTEPQEPHPASDYEFFDILPSFEIVLPEVESDARPDREPVSIEEPGNYVLQAGSFNSAADAESRKATIALLGIESRIQRVAIDDDVWFRVRIGPTSDLDDLNRTRRQIRQAEIDVMLMTVPN